MPTPKKLNNGKWRARVYIGKDEDGKPKYKCITTDTKAECQYQIGLAAATPYVPKPQKGDVVTVRDAIKKYIDMSQVLSPTTLHAYEKVMRFAFPGIMDQSIDSLDDIAMQEAINAELTRKSPRGTYLSAKTVKNEWGVVSSALRAICKRTYDIRLPKVARKIETLPEVSEIMAVIKGSSVELPCLLAMCMSFSMSEIRGIMCSSVRNGCIYIERVTVNVGADDIVKETAKTDTRIRVQKVPAFMLPMIEASEPYKKYKATGEDGFLVPLTRNQLYYGFTIRARSAGLDLTFHDLRHVFASVMLTELNIPEKIVQQEGGWSTPHVMKSVYSQTFSSSQQRADAMRDEYFEKTYCTK